MKKTPGCLGCIGDDTTQYMGIFISQYKDPYKPTSIIESSSLENRDIQVWGG